MRHGFLCWGTGNAEAMERADELGGAAKLIQVPPLSRTQPPVPVVLSSHSAPQALFDPSFCERLQHGMGIGAIAFADGSEPLDGNSRCRQVVYQRSPKESKTTWII